MTRSLFKVNILCLLFVFTCIKLQAQDHIQFKNYTITEGLSQSTVSSIIQDRLGSLWIGTQDGINRFNGKSFEVYSADKGYDISNEYINTAFKDRKGNLWFGTNNGLVKHNILMEKFSSFQLKGDKHLDILSIDEDSDGSLWLGTSYGDIFKFDVKDNTFNLVDNGVFQSKIIDLKWLNNQLVIVSEFEGVLITDKYFNNRNKIKPSHFEKEGFIINGLITSPHYDISITTSEGVFYFSDETNTFQPYDGILSVLKGINIKDVVFLSDNRLLAASDHDGLFQVYTDNNDSIVVLNYLSDIFQKGSLISNKLNGLFKDNQGNIWITSERGLSSFNPKHIGFKGVGISNNRSNGLASLNVWGFAESEDERFLYIAGDHGVSAFDRIEHKFYHYQRSSKFNEDFIAISLFVIDNNTLLVGCVDGLFELKINKENREEYTYKKYTHEEEYQRSHDIIYTIVPYHQENQYLLGSRRGMMWFDYSTGKFEYLQNESGAKNTISPGSVRFIFEYNNEYYASPSSGGLYKVKLENGKLRAYSSHLFSPLNDKITNYFFSYYKDINDVFWFGTAGEGLVKYDIKNKEIKIFDKSKGLPNNVIYGVESSILNPNYIWLSTNKGVVAFNRNTELFYTFSEEDGLMSNELNLGASFVAKNGEIYLGGIQGYNYFNPYDAFGINENIRVYFSGIEIDNEVILPKEEGILTKNIAFTKYIKLPYNKRSLKLKFFADDLINPERIEYKYVLKGKEDIEEDLGLSNELRFTSLAPGVYELFIYARSSNGEWNKFPAELTIELERPFWLKWWFYVISLSVIILYLMYRVRKRIDDSRRRQVRLEMKIAERTRELRKKNEQIQLQANRLREQTIELEREQEKSRRLLNNVLPKETASQLMKDGRATAREFSKVSIMFTDFVGFSQIAEEMSAKDLVSILDMHFRQFDRIIDKNNLEKIKTIGDAYMAAGGVPIRNKTNPIHTALAAVQIKNYMLDYKKKQITKGEPYWKLRIGINTGAVSAGVIGSKRYAYDIWGSAVNRAQRMEQLCEPEKIAVSQDTFDYIEPYFECKRIGKIKTKSGVRIMMYELVSIKPELSVDGLGVEPNDAFHKLVNLHHFSKINYSKAERFILSKLKKELSPKLHYHSYIHSKDVTRQVERIAIGEGITDEDLFLLKSAASYHDAGFIEQYDKNESIGARMAAEILPNFGYTESDIKKIKELIYVTSVPHKPKNKLEEIICDADLDYLGRDDFHEISDKLRRELKEHGKINSDREWDKIQVKFFNQHRFFTKTSIETRLEKKMQNLEEIKKRIEEDNYED